MSSERGRGELVWKVFFLMFGIFLHFFLFPPFSVFIVFGKNNFNIRKVIVFGLKQLRQTQWLSSFHIHMSRVVKSCFQDLGEGVWLKEQYPLHRRWGWGEQCIKGHSERIFTMYKMTSIWALFLKEASYLHTCDGKE